MQHNILRKIRTRHTTLDFGGDFVAFLIDLIIVIIIGCVGGIFIGLMYVLLAEATTDGDISPDAIGTGAGILGFIWGIAVDCIYFTVLEFFNASDAGKNGFEHDCHELRIQEDWVLAGKRAILGEICFIINLWYRLSDDCLH